MATHPTPMSVPPSTFAPSTTRTAPAAKPAPQPVVSPPHADDEYCRHPASDAPVRRGDRIAFQIWVVCVLLTVALTLVFYLIDKIYMNAKG
jgi:hypothetical protein